MARVPRIYHPQPLRGLSRVQLTDQAAQHLVRVLRMTDGAELILFDGTEGEYRAQICTSSRHRVEVELLGYESRGCESPLRLTLAQGVSKGERMDLTIQKAVELGVSRIAPLDTERSVVNLKGDRRDKKLAHWQGVIISACEQCGRNTLPELLPWQVLHEWLAEPQDGARILLDHRAESGLRGLAPSSSVTLLIGPEGGLSVAEREAAMAAGYHGVSLGPRVLRTETAALTAIAALQTLWGDLA